jgi:tRNA-dihydrouridine synthase A
VRGDPARFLAHDPAAHPVALQLGGSDPGELAIAARRGEEAGFVEINLNVGCPSSRVQAGRFGACLIAEPGLVAECVSAMRAAVSVPVTVKTRLGVDALDSQEHLEKLVSAVVSAGCDVLILHARKALLNFSTRANREIPPLQYARVHALKRRFPALPVILNGGLDSLEACVPHLDTLDGVMLGRAAYGDLALLAQVDGTLFDAPSTIPSRGDVLRALEPYVLARCAEGTALRHLSRHWLGLHQGRAGARAWRKLIGLHSTSAAPHPARAVAEAADFLDALGASSSALDSQGLRNRKVMRSDSPMAV